MDSKLDFITDWEKGLDSFSEFSELCRRYGISRQTGYTIVGRYGEQGWDGLEARSRAPHNRPVAMDEGPGGNWSICGGRTGLGAEKAEGVVGGESEQGGDRRAGSGGKHDWRHAGPRGADPPAAAQSGRAAAYPGHRLPATTSGRSTSRDGSGPGTGNGASR